MINVKKKVLLFIYLGSLFVVNHTAEADADESPKDDGTENTTDYRLPGNVVPYEYYIKITPFIEPDNFTFDGIVKINATVLKSTTEIVMHADDITVDNVTVSSIDTNKDLSTQLEVENITRTDKYHFLNIMLKSPLNVGTNITIEISYTGKLNNEMYGFFHDWIRINNEYRWILGTQFEPTGARRAFPCFDEPALKAVFQVVLVVPEKYTAISNMPIRSIENTETKENIVEFERSPIMSTYTVAMMVVEFASLGLPILTNQGSPRSYRVWSNPELAYQLPYALQVIPKALDFFGKKLDMPYPIAKLEMVAFPDFPPAAMENWGLNLYSEMFMLYDKNVTPLRIKRYIRNLVTHELTHQWFGNLVTPKWWDYLWLSESFAAYFEYHAHEDELASWNLESQFVVNEMHEAFATDAVPNIHPIIHQVYSPDEIMSLFDPISYNKGASIIRMIEKLLGPEIFFDALKRYMNTAKYSTGTPESLNSAFEDAIENHHHKLNISVNEFINSWTTKPGYPVLHVRFDGDIVTLEQSRFFQRPNKSSTSNETWVIPITWASQSKLDFNETRSVTWMTDKSTAITIPNATTDWVIINVQQAGFYRVNYDNKMWERIINLLKSEEHEVIHELNRASLMNDLFNLGVAGMIDYRIVLSASQYLSNETNYIPWRTSFTSLTYLKKRFIGHPEIYDIFKVYVTSLLEPHYKRLGFNEKSGEKDFDILFREILLKWLCELNHAECISHSLDLFQKLRHNDSFVISPNLQSAVFCTAIKHGTFEDWTYLWNRFEKSNFAIEKLTILSSLVCASNATYLDRLLQSIITPTNNKMIRKQDIKDIFTIMSDASLIGADKVIDFLDANFEDVLKAFNDNSTVSYMLMTIAENMSTDSLAEKYTKFIENNYEKATSIAETMNDTLKVIQYNLDWNKKNIPYITNWLKENYSS